MVYIGAGLPTLVIVCIMMCIFVFSSIEDIYYVHNYEPALQGR